MPNLPETPQKPTNGQSSEPTADSSKEAESHSPENANEVSSCR